MHSEHESESEPRPWINDPPGNEDRQGGPFGIVSCLVVVGSLVVLMTMLPPVLAKVREKANRSGCKGNHRRITQSLFLYRDTQGKAVNLPAFDGSSFLTALYVAGATTSADDFICPSSGDDNTGLVFATGPGSNQLTSYAGRRNATQSTYPGLYTAKGASETTVMSDDSEGTARFNHDECCIMGFADGHCEEVPTDDSRLVGIVAVGSGILDPLAN